MYCTLAQQRHSQGARGDNDLLACLFQLSGHYVVQVTVVGQVLPVLMSIRMQLTSMHISFRPRSIEFGQCNLGENTGVTVQVTNHSLLPQKYGESSASGPLFTQTRLCVMTVFQVHHREAINLIAQAYKPAFEPHCDPFDTWSQT